MKKSSFFLSLLMLLALGAVNLQAATKITDVANIESGKTYYIGATTSGGTDYYFSVDGSTASADVKAGTSVTSRPNAASFVFTQSGTNWTLKFANSANYLALSSDKANGKVLISATAVDWTITNNTAKSLLTLMCGSTYALQKNSSGSQFGSYAKTQNDVWLEEVTYDPSITIEQKGAAITEVAFGDVEQNAETAGYGYSVIKTIDVKGENLTNNVYLEITSNGSGTFAIYDPRYASLQSHITISPTAGVIDTSIVITAYTLQATTGDRAGTLNVRSLATPADFTAFDIDLTATVIAPHTITPDEYAINLNNVFFDVATGENAVEQTATQNDITFVAGCTSSATSKTFYDAGHVRFYANSYLKIYVPLEYVIDSIEFTAGGTWNESGILVSNSVGEYNAPARKWKGNAREVDFVFTLQCRIKTVTVTFSKATDVQTPIIAGTTPFLHSTTVTITCASTGSTIYYTTDGTNPTSASTEYTGSFTLDATTTVKAIAVRGSDESVISTKTFTKAVPVTVADALTTIAALNENGKTPDSVYVIGYVKSIEDISQTYHYALYTIKDLDVDNELTIYRGYYVGNTDFTASSTLNVGDKVVVKGILMKYVNDNVTTPEATAGNYIVERTERGAVTSLALGGELLKTSGYEAGDIISTEGLTASATFANGFVKDVTAEATWTVDGYEQKVIYNPESDYVFGATYGGQTKTKVIRVYANTHAVTFNQPAHGTLTVKYAGTPITSGQTFTKGAKLTVEVSVDDDYQLTALTAGEEDILTSKAFTIGTSDIAVVATIAKIQKLYTLTLHVATYPDRGVAEAELFKAISFETFDNDDAEGHDFVQYDSEDNIVMKGTFYDGTVLNFENFESQSYKFVKWDDPEETNFYRGVEIFSDTAVTLYVAPILLQPIIATQDEAKGIVELIKANPLPASEFFNEESTWTLQIKATPKPGYKFLGWGPFDLEKAVGEDPELDWFSGLYLTVEEFFAEGKAYYDQLVAAGDVLNEEQKAYREYLKQVFSAEATFTPYQIYEYEVAFDFDFNEEYYSVKAFFTEDTNTSINSVTGNPSPVTEKMIRDGHLFLLHDGKTFTITGQELK